MIMNTQTYRRLATGLLATWMATAAWGFTPSAQPPSTTAVPGNVMLALSVEFPTGLQVSYDTTNYNNVGMEAKRGV